MLPLQALGSSSQRKFGWVLLKPHLLERGTVLIESVLPFLPQASPADSSQSLLTSCFLGVVLRFPCSSVCPCMLRCFVLHGWLHCFSE